MVGKRLFYSRHEPIVEDDTFNTVQAILAGNKILQTKTNKSKEYLKGHLICGDCGKSQRSSWSKGRNKYYGYYHCEGKWGVIV